MRRWYENVGRGSEITADVYLRRLGSFCVANSLTPASLASKPPHEIQSALLDYVTDHQGFAGSYVLSTMKAVRSWLAANDVELRQKIKIKGAKDTPSLRDERVPTKQELRRILLSATKQSRVAIALMAFAGVRPEVLGDYKGHDGLRLGDFAELKVNSSKTEFEKIPAMVLVRSTLSKARIQYFTFLGDEGCGYIIDYLRERSGRLKEELTADSPLIRPRFAASKKFIRTTNVGDMIRVAIRRADFRWRPYVLRARFDTQLLLAESKGNIVRDFRTFFMGHVGDIESRYTTGKHRLPQDLIDDMRASYQRSQGFLQTIEPEMKEDDFKLMFKKELLLVSGFAEEETTKLDLAA